MDIRDKGVVRVLNTSDMEECVDFLVCYDWNKCLKHPRGTVLCIRWIKAGDEIQREAFRRAFSAAPLLDNQEVVKRVVADARRWRRNIELSTNLSHVWAESLLGVSGYWRMVRFHEGLSLSWGKFEDSRDLLLWSLRYLVSGVYWWTIYRADIVREVEMGIFLSWLSQNSWVRAIAIRHNDTTVEALVASSSRELLEIEPIPQEGFSAAIVRTRGDMLLSLDYFRSRLVYWPERKYTVVAIDPSCSRPEERDIPFLAFGD